MAKVRRNERGRSAHDVYLAGLDGPSRMNLRRQPTQEERARARTPARNTTVHVPGTVSSVAASVAASVTLDVRKRLLLEENKSELSEWYDRSWCRIGKGTYGSVYETKDLRTGKNVVLKVVWFDNAYEPAKQATRTKWRLDADYQSEYLTVVARSAPASPPSGGTVGAAAVTPTGSDASSPAASASPNTDMVARVAAPARVEPARSTSGSSRSPQQDECTRVQRWFQHHHSRFQADMRDFVREVCLMQDMKHPHVVELYRVHVRDTYGVLVLEPMLCDFNQIVHRSPCAMNYDMVCQSVFQILQAVEYAHRQGIMHRDLKPHNLLVTVSRRNVKVGDWGMGRYARSARAEAPKSTGSRAARRHRGSLDDQTRSHSPRVVSLPYRAPELLLGQPYGLPVDLWSVGCILFEMVMKRLPFDARSEMDLLAQMYDERAAPHSATSTSSIYSTTCSPVSGGSGAVPANRPRAAVAGTSRGTKRKAHDAALDEPVAPVRTSFDDPTFRPDPVRKDLRTGAFSAHPTIGHCPHALDLLVRLLEVRPTHRITAAQALAHPYFRRFHTLLLTNQPPAGVSPSAARPRPRQE